MTQLAQMASKAPMNAHGPLWRILSGWDRNDRFDISSMQDEGRARRRG